MPCGDLLGPLKQLPARVGRRFAKLGEFDHEFDVQTLPMLLQEEARHIRPLEVEDHPDSFCSSVLLFEERNAA